MARGAPTTSVKKAAHRLGRVLPTLLTAGLVLAGCDAEVGPPSANGRPATTQPTLDQQLSLVFPVQEVASGYESLIEGTLIRRARCILVRTASRNLYLPFWPPDTSYERTEGGLVITHEGQVVARVGEPISLGGAGAVRPAALREKAGGCPGRYWLVSTINLEG